MRGDMSLVGPRPEVKEFVDLFPREYARILTVRPGITHQGTLMFRNEEDILAGAANPRTRYLRFVMPLKLKIYQDLLVQPLAAELKIILATVFPTLWLKSYPAFEMAEPAVASMPTYAQQAEPVLGRSEKAMEEMA
jgi:lipopolysaccharide/colanic/teichoic acid biosynthesis glycosyltransferase